MTENDKIHFGRCSDKQIIQYGRLIFFINMNILRHLKLEIALAIPASNDVKIEANNSAAQGLILIYCHDFF